MTPTPQPQEAARLASSVIDDIARELGLTAVKDADYRAEIGSDMTEPEQERYNQMHAFARSIYALAQPQAQPGQVDEATENARFRAWWDENGLGSMSDQCEAWLAAKHDTQAAAQAGSAASLPAGWRIARDTCLDKTTCLTVFSPAGTGHSIYETEWSTRVLYNLLDQLDAARAAGDGDGDGAKP